MASRQRLEGLKVLLVEDESLVSMLAEDALVDAGGTVLLAMRLEEALTLAREEALDLAVLDVNLGGGDTSFPVADVLLDRGIPFIFVTGYAAKYAANSWDLRYAQCKIVHKPYTLHALVEAASEVANRSKGPD